MKFLCTKVKPSWLTSQQNKEKVENLNLKIKDSFVGVEIRNNSPSEEELKFINDAVDKLFGNHKIAFPVKVVEL